MKAETVLKADLAKVSELCPKLKYYTNDKGRVLKGDLDICDVKGQYWDTFEIGILIPLNYPYGVPIVAELSTKIPRIDDRHISKHGFCCVEIDHELQFLAKKGLSLFDFISEKVYPYFANQLYYEKEGHYAKHEHKHGFDGVRVFYAEKLNIQDYATAIKFLDSILNGRLPSRNDECFCCSGKKIKHCHYESLNFLRSIDIKRLTEDRKEFGKLLEPQVTV